jgi:2-polyprenyl-3-methyl-5-hydroxy-6-metoxy-1,4-benzoquinol methylase
MFGDFNAKVRENKDFFKLTGIEPRSGGKALDLGCGSGFQSIALENLGFRVLSVDMCETLLNELRNRSAGRDINAVQGDILDQSVYADKGPFEVAVCMGDTLTHLQETEEVSALLANIYPHLEEGGRLALSFRDLTDDTTLFLLREILAGNLEKAHTESFVLACTKFKIFCNTLVSVSSPVRCKRGFLLL